MPHAAPVEFDEQSAHSSKTEALPQHYGYQPFHWQIPVLTLPSATSPREGSLDSYWVDNFGGQPIYVVRCEDGTLLYCAYAKHCRHEQEVPSSKEISPFALRSNSVPRDSKFGSRTMSNSPLSQPCTTATADVRHNEAEVCKESLSQEPTHINAAEQHDHRRNPRTVNNQNRKFRGPGGCSRRKRRRPGNQT
jgi:hypothetical protein